LGTEFQEALAQYNVKDLKDLSGKILEIENYLMTAAGVEGYTEPQAQEVVSGIKGYLTGGVSTQAAKELERLATKYAKPVDYPAPKDPFSQFTKALSEATAAVQNFRASFPDGSLPK